MPGSRHISETPRTRCGGEGERPRSGVLFLGAAAAALSLYLLTLAPTVTAEDSGELVTAAVTLGVAHPPGYPLWCLLGKLFSAIPSGSPAWRVNLLSAVLGALSVGLLATVALRLTRNPGASLTAALAFAASRDFWSQCVVAEVYSLNVLQVLALLWLVLAFETTCRARWLYLGAFAAGLGLTNHSTMGPLAVLCSAWVLLRHLGLLLRPLLLLNLSLAFLLGFSIVLYLPIRSAADPLLDWGDPETLRGTLDHLLRRQYTQEEVTAPRTIGRQATLLWHFLLTFSAQFTPPVAALAFLGALECTRRTRALSLLLGSLFVLTSYGFIWLLHPPPDREHLHLTRVFFLPAHAVGALWLACSLERTRQWASERTVRSLRALRLLGLLAAAALVLLVLRVNFPLNDRSRDTLAYDWGRNLLLSLKPDAIILPASDHSTFPVLYLHAVEGLRPDVKVGNKYGYLEARFFREIFEGRHPPRSPPPFGRSLDEQQAWLVEHSGRPVYFTTKVELPGLPGWELRTWGLLFEAVPTSAEAPDEGKHRAVWEEMAFHPGSLERAPGDFGCDLILADYHYARGRFDLLFGREGAAVETFRAAARHGAGVAAILNNLGAALAEAERNEAAIPFLAEALRLEPHYDLAARNLASVYFALERYPEGLRLFEWVLEREPRHPVASLGTARAHRALGRRRLALLWYRSLLRGDPRDLALEEEARSFAREAFGEDEAEGVRELAASLRSGRSGRDPEPPELLEGPRKAPEVLDGRRELPEILEARREPHGLRGPPEPLRELPEPPAPAAPPGLLPVPWVPSGSGIAPGLGVRDRTAPPDAPLGPGPHGIAP